MPEYHVAQINIARMLAPIDNPIMQDFVAQLPPINALAEQSPGFVWRLQSESGDATSIKVYDDDMIIINLTVWEDVDSLRQFVYKSNHSEVMRHRRRWFEKFKGPYSALWWVPAGHLPDPQEGKERLEHLRGNGDSEYAFSFEHAFPKPYTASAFSLRRGRKFSLTLSTSDDKLSTSNSLTKGGTKK
jgi:hypothetical protein